MTDLLLAIGHHLAAFALVALIAAEFAVLRPGLGGRGLNRLLALDGAVGAAAGVVLAVGIGRVAFGAKGAAFYLGDPWFWGKMVAFAAIAGLSIVPTLTFFRWRRQARADAAFAPTAEARHRVRRVLAIELALVPVVLVCAAAMARWGAF